MISDYETTKLSIFLRWYLEYSTSTVYGYYDHQFSSHEDSDEYNICY